jgi:hypothetical protein
VGGASGGGAAGFPLTAGVCREPRRWNAELEACAGDFVHRVAPGQCNLAVRDEEIPDLPVDAGEEDFANDPLCDPPYRTCRLDVNECTRDADCADGYCLRTVRETLDEEYTNTIVWISHRCSSPCATDSDCASEQACTCRNARQNATRDVVPFGYCYPADCRTDADCGKGAFCIASLTQSSPGAQASNLGTFHCQSPDDECHGPAFCPVIDENGCCAVPTCHHDGDRFVCGEEETCELCSR